MRVCIHFYACELFSVSFVVFATVIIHDIGKYVTRVYLSIEQRIEGWMFALHVT